MAHAKETASKNGRDDPPASANTLFAAADAEALWQFHYGRAGKASKIASELDAVFCISEPDSDRRYLFRIASNADGTLNLQAAVLSHVALVAPELPVPRVHKDRSGEFVISVPSAGREQYAAFATTFLPGRPAASLKQPPAIQCGIFKLLASLDRALEGYSHPNLRRSLLWDVSCADQAAPLVNTIPDPAIRKLSQQAFKNWRTEAAPLLPRLRKQIIHNDCNPSNILVNGNGEITGLIDFGDVIEAPLVCDLATAVAYQEPVGGFDALLARAVDAYTSIIPLNDEELSILPVLVQARAAMVVSIAHWRATQHPANRDYLLRNTPLAIRLLQSAAGHPGTL